MQSKTSHPIATTKFDGVADADTLTPADRYQELFVTIQTSRVFADSKTFVDCVPLRQPALILEDYRQQQSDAGFELLDFVKANFRFPGENASHYVSIPDQSLPDHIDGLWDVLSRDPDEHPEFTSLLALPGRYVVPGERFRELYYWDSYFTMLGLAESGRADLVHAMADNFAYLIDTYGHIPNGTRTYYLSRSQPPLFALMVELFRENGHDETRYLPQLRREHAFWMDGAETLLPGEAHRHVVKLADGALLNRYWDDRDSPREESYLEDVATAQKTRRPASDVYRDLRAGAESGWDFTSRWLQDPRDMSTIRTTSILPVDLNAFLYKLETKIAELGRESGNETRGAEFSARAEARAAAMNELHWNAGEGAFLDYDWQLRQQRETLSIATSVPLFVGMATNAQATAVAGVIRSRLLQPGGVATTEVESGQQWDQPNGWAPLQWMAIAGLRTYRQNELADEIAHRWLHTVGALYQQQNKLVEKYVLHDAVGGSGGEYPLQSGFGWTNGVVRRLLALYPEHGACNARAGEAHRS